MHIWPLTGSEWAAFWSACLFGMAVLTLWLASRRVKEELRPVVLVWAQLREQGSDLVELIVENTGREPAVDVRIRWTPPLPNVLSTREVDINDLPLWDAPVLMPHVPFRLDLGRGVHLLAEPMTRYVAEVEYSRSGGRGERFSERLTVDIETFLGTSVARRGPAPG